MIENRALDTFKNLVIFQGKMFVRLALFCFLASVPQLNADEGSARLLLAKQVINAGALRKLFVKF
jgi:hypothetical protein